MTVDRMTRIAKQSFPRNSFDARSSFHPSLITERAWDDYDLKSLLPLKEVVKEDSRFGFLLRHYWIPATELRFRQSSRVTAPDGSEDRQELQIDRQMARCRSNECTWREKVHDVAAIDGSDVGQDSALLSELLCSYDCYEQTYVSAKPILFELPTSDQREESRRQALHRLAILVPPGPVPIGFTWYAKVGDDYMNLSLEAEHRLKETSVLVIRREGHYTVRLGSGQSDPAGHDWCLASDMPQKQFPSPSGIGHEPSPVVIERRGVTLFAWNRGVVLEDRIWDHVVDAGASLSSLKGSTIQSVVRLVRSTPTEDS
jgi:hypothetical protein